MIKLRHLLCLKQSHQALIHPQCGRVHRERAKERGSKPTEKPAISTLGVYLASGADERRSGVCVRRCHHTAMILVRSHHCGLSRTGIYFLTLSAGMPIDQNTNDARPPERKFAVGVLICCSV